jgi:hypothetical protein
MIRGVNRKDFEGTATATIASTADKLSEAEFAVTAEPQKRARLRREEVELEHYRNSTSSLEATYASLVLGVFSESL